MVIQYGLVIGGGLCAGILAGFLGIGGGTLLVPLLVTLHYSPVQSVATSSLAILMTSLAGSWQNWRMGFFRWQPVLGLGLPAIGSAQLGAYLAGQLPPALLLVAFGFLLLSTMYLLAWRQRLAVQPQTQTTPCPSWLAYLGTGVLAGLLAGLFGIGGGVILVPLQMVLLGQTIKTAVQTSLGVIVITAVSAVVGHAWAGNVRILEGLLLGLGGMIGVQFSTRWLPRLPDAAVAIAFRLLLLVLAAYMFWQATQI